jgi:hypothetical protein
MSIRVDTSILNQNGTPAFNANAFAFRPAAGYIGRIFISTDSKQIFRDTGSAWDLISDAGAGSGNLQSVTANGNYTPYGINITSGGLFLLGSTNGGIFFADGGSGQFTQDATTLFWDNTNKRLGIGTATPGVRLDVHSSSGTNVTFNGTGVTNAVATFQSAGTSKWSLGNYVSSAVANDFCIYDNVNGSYRLYVHNTGVINIPASLIIGSSTPTSSYTFDVTGSGKFSSTLTLGTILQGSVLFAGSGGLITQNNSNFFWDNTNNRLGIGTASPTYTLDITATQSNTFRITQSINGDNYININNTSTGTSATSRIDIGVNSGSYATTIQRFGLNYVGNLFGVSCTNSSAIYDNAASSNGLFIGAVSATPIIFGTSNAERFRIASDGSMSNSNAAANVSALTITASSTSGQSFGLKVKGGTTSGDTAFLVQNVSGSTDYFRVRGDGLLFASGIYNNTNANLPNVWVNSDGSLYRSTSSSIRNKENINDWNGSGLDTILALKPKTFKYKKDYYNLADVDFLGLIAEEVAEVSPYLAEYENQDRTGQVENVRYATIVVPLIKAIQELNEKLVRNNIN